MPEPSEERQRLWCGWDRENERERNKSEVRDQAGGQMGRTQCPRNHSGFSSETGGNRVDVCEPRRDSISLTF